MDFETERIDVVIVVANHMTYLPNYSILMNGKHDFFDYFSCRERRKVRDFPP